MKKLHDDLSASDQKHFFSIHIITLKSPFEVEMMIWAIKKYYKTISSLPSSVFVCFTAAAASGKFVICKLILMGNCQRDGVEEEIGETMK
jgi:hypothetical protein